MKALRLFALYALVASVASVAPSMAQAGGLFAPFSMDSAATLPKGVRSVRLNGFTTEMSNRFGANGQIEPLAANFNKAVTWGDLTDAQTPGFERGQFKGGLEALGIQMSDVVGDSTAAVNTRVTMTMPVAAYGVTDWLTVGVAVPVVYSNVSVSSGWTGNARLQGALDKLSQGGYYNKVISNEARLQNVVETKIAGYGYKPLESESHTDLGDVTLAAKVQAYKDENWVVAIAPKVVAPTGRVADVDKVVDVASGDGQWDLGVTAVSDYKLGRQLTLTASAGYVVQLPTEKTVRLPISLDQSLSGDVETGVREKLGDIWSAGVAGRWAYDEAWSLGAGYSFQRKYTDTYTGSKFAASAPERYLYLSDETDQSMHTAQVGAAYSTVAAYRAGKFEVPLEATVNYSTVLGGRNVGQANLTSLELAMFF